MSVQLTRRGALMSGGAMIALTACGEARKPPAAPDANAGFDALSKSWLDDLARSSPVYATGLGDHRFDGELPDVSDAGRAARMAQVKATQAKLAALDRATLSRDNQVDAAMIAELTDAWPVSALPFCFFFPFRAAMLRLQRVCRDLGLGEENDTFRLGSIILRQGCLLKYHSFMRLVSDGSGARFRRVGNQFVEQSLQVICGIEDFYRSRRGEFQFVGSCVHEVLELSECRNAFPFDGQTADHRLLGHAEARWMERIPAEEPLHASVPARRAGLQKIQVGAEQDDSHVRRFQAGRVGTELDQTEISAMSRHGHCPP